MVIGSLGEGLGNPYCEYLLGVVGPILKGSLPPLQEMGFGVKNWARNHDFSLWLLISAFDSFALCHF